MENRKTDLIKLLQKHQVVSDPRELTAWTLSELEQEWKRYQKWEAKDIS
ncbi:MAG: hypothetical protein ABF651_03225 [Sporolactobacillus sp.]